MAGRHLPILTESEDIVSSLDKDGRRHFVYPADVRGRFHKLRKVVFAALVAIWVALPIVTVNGHPALFLDVQHRRFFIFGSTFNAQDVWLVFFLLTGFGFLLALATSLFGRVWCGYACPQTVFLDGFFRPIERLVEGPREQRMKLDKAPWTFNKVWRRLLKHALFFATAFFVSHVFLSFFVSIPSLFEMVQRPPSEHPEAFTWAAVLTLILYGNFAWFREQVCLIVCPYGRMQSVLFDPDSLIIGYDAKRGEPRGKLSEKGKGDCVDCRRCVAVCPTGIDIRNGLQLDCIACAACVDACDEIMDKVGRPRGLVRYDSQRGLAGEPKHFLRPRLAIYAVLGVMGLSAATFAFSRRTTFEANMLREKGAPFVVDGPTVRNSFSLHLVNKLDRTDEFALEPEPSQGLEFSLPFASVTVGPLDGTKVNVVVTGQKGAYGGDKPVFVRVKRASDGETFVAKAKFVGPT